jgi:hypothetical protein
MTREKWATMSPDERRIKVAELCGWQNIHLCTWDDLHEYTSPFGDNPLDGCLDSPVGKPPQGHVRDLLLIPRYEDNLNALQWIVNELTEIQLCKFVQILAGHTTRGEKIQWCGEDAGRVAKATAAQRAEALALVLEPE